MLHGGGGTAASMERYTRWSEKADKEGFLAAYREATRPDPTKPAVMGVGGRAKPPVKVSVEKWVNALGCSAEPRVIYDKEGVKGYAYSCDRNSTVVYYTIEGMGHHWPGSSGTYLPESYIGRKVDTIKANDFIWDFLASQKKVR